MYACDKRIDADVRVHLGDTQPESTMNFRSKRKKENEASALRRRVVETECEWVEKLKSNADIVV